MFIDEIKIYAQAGHGGKGAVAFHREAYITKGGPPLPPLGPPLVM